MKKRKDKQVDSCCSPRYGASPTSRRGRKASRHTLAPAQGVRKSTRMRRAKPLDSFDGDSITSDADWELARPWSRRRPRRSDATSDMELTSAPRADVSNQQAPVAGDEYQLGGGVGLGGGGTAPATPALAPTSLVVSTPPKIFESPFKLP